MFEPWGSFKKFIDEVYNPDVNEKLTEVANHDDGCNNDDEAEAIILHFYVAAGVFCRKNRYQAVYAAHRKIQCIDADKYRRYNKHALQKVLKQFFILKRFFHILCLSHKDN